MIVQDWSLINISKNRKLFHEKLFLIIPPACQVEDSAVGEVRSASSCDKVFPGSLSRPGVTVSVDDRGEGEGGVVVVLQGPRHHVLAPQEVVEDDHLLGSSDILHQRFHLFEIH